MAFIYLLAESATGPVKVGVSGNPGARRGELQTGNPRELMSIGCWELTRNEAFGVERTILDDWAECAMSGEWVDADPADIRSSIELEIEALRDGGILHSLGWPMTRCPK